jgi:hypothetical protein
MQGRFIKDKLKKNDSDAAKDANRSSGREM